ncbi:hypothetical protein HYV88_04535 [Candidatus Woesearchaeota archaeon]|nr:hypothetical protein [Candidatus Woesearchaeota archaeon]
MSEKLPSLLVVDASILFSFFKKDSDRRVIIEILPSLGCKLISPEHMFEELSKEREKIKRFGGINELAFTFLFSLLDNKIESFSEDMYTEFLAEASKISPHKDSTKDDSYFALALKLNCPIWSDETAFKQQARIKVFNTKELLGLINKS